MHLLQLGGDHQDAEALVGELLDEVWISALAPTSMPRVGSSRISSFGFIASQRASSTFCWLPPESSRIVWSGSAAFDAEPAMNFSTSSLAAWPRRRRRHGRAAASAPASGSPQPTCRARCLRACGLRSEKPMPRVIASIGSRGAEAACPPAMSAPARLVGAEDEPRGLGAARAQQARKPAISPRRTLNETS